MSRHGTHIEKIILSNNFQLLREDSIERNKECRVGLHREGTEEVSH